MDGDVPTACINGVGPTRTTVWSHHVSGIASKPLPQPDTRCSPIAEHRKADLSRTHSTRSTSPY